MTDKFNSVTKQKNLSLIRFFDGSMTDFKKFCQHKRFSERLITDYVANSSSLLVIVIHDYWNVAISKRRRKGLIKVLYLIDLQSVWPSFFLPKSIFFSKLKYLAKFLEGEKVFLRRRRISFGEEEKNSLSSKSIFFKKRF